MKTLQLGEDLTLPLDAVTEADRNWAAGLFEGEGTVTLALRSLDETYRLVVTMANTNHQILDFFQDRWPGWIQPAYGKRPGRQPAWYWTLAWGKAECFLREIEPYLRTHRVREKFRVALAFRDHQSRSASVWNKPDYKPRQRALYLEMKALNKRGIA